MALRKALLAEFIGTFTLLLLGAGAATMVTLGIGTLVTVAFAHSFAIIALIYTYGHVSGTHINPAVTISLAVAGTFERARVIPYIIAQLLGAIVAGFALRFVFGSAETELGATGVDYAQITLGGAFFLEFIGTFFLATTVLNAAVSGKAGNMAPIAIGVIVPACIFLFGPLTGASLNPARTIGPAVAAGVFTDFWMYLVATTGGGIVAGGLYRMILEPEE